MWKKIREWFEERATLILLNLYKAKKSKIIQFIKDKVFGLLIKKIAPKIGGIRLWAITKAFNYLWDKIAPNTLLKLMRVGKSKVREWYLRNVAKKTVEAENEKQYRNSLDDLFK